MPGPVVTATAVVTCTHAGKATPTVPASRVTVMGSPVVTTAMLYQIAGCQLPTVTSGAPPCVTGRITMGALRVTSMGSPVVTASSLSTCIPTGQPMLITATQTRVNAT
jgi:hypothetical protein